MASGIPTTLSDLLSRLEFLSQIQPGQKVCMSDYTLIDTRSWISWTHRSMLRENRSISLSNINQVIERSINAINEYVETEFMGLLIEAMNKAYTGISNLKAAYESDPWTLSAINVCLSNIKMQLKKYKKFLHVESTNEIKIDL